MKKTHLLLVVLFSLVTLKYDLSAFIQPLWFETIPEVESAVSIKINEAGSTHKITIAEL